MNWYFAVDGCSQGPVTAEALADLARAGEVGTDTLLWHPGLEEWEPVWKIRPEILEDLNKNAMARQAKGTTDRIPLADFSAETAPAEASEGVFGRLFGKLRKR